MLHFTFKFDALPACCQSEIYIYTHIYKTEGSLAQ